MTCSLLNAGDCDEHEGDDNDLSVVVSKQKRSYLSFPGISSGTELILLQHEYKRPQDCRSQKLPKHKIRFLAKVTISAAA